MNTTLCYLVWLTPGWLCAFPSDWASGSCVMLGRHWGGSLWATLLQVHRRGDQELPASWQQQYTSVVSLALLTRSLFTYWASDCRKMLHKTCGHPLPFTVPTIKPLNHKSPRLSLFKENCISQWKKVGSFKGSGYKDDKCAKYRGLVSVFAERW